MGLIQFSSPLGSQPNGLARPSQRWLNRGLVFASTLAQPYESVNGRVASITGTKPTAYAKGVARGFGATVGAGTTDCVQVTSVPRDTFLSFVVRARRDGAGGGNLGRLLMHGINLLYHNNASSRIMFERDSTGTRPSWFWPQLTAGVYQTICVTSSGISSTPILYLDGIRQAAATLEVGGTGSTATATANVIIGNNAITGGVRVWDGAIGDSFIFNSILSDSEAAELSDTNRIWQKRRIWVPVPAASGPPTLAAIAASDLTASGARLTVT